VICLASANPTLLTPTIITLIFPLTPYKNLLASLSASESILTNV